MKLRISARSSATLTAYEVVPNNKPSGFRGMLLISHGKMVASVSVSVTAECIVDD